MSDIAAFGTARATVGSLRDHIARFAQLRRPTGFSRSCERLAQNLKISPAKALLCKEIDMNVTLDFVESSLDDIKAALDGGTLTVYSVA
ncbi:MAG: hypothetical protein E7B62_12485, partial [Bradyrhizobium sp.]|nr:hypothetical protein [Bradyrhizobium sp.]